jgi:hypothetical protein
VEVSGVELPEGVNAGWLDGVVAWAVAQFVAILVWGARLELRMRNVEETPRVVRKIDKEVAVLANEVGNVKDSVDSLHEKFDRLVESGRLHPETRTFRER